MLTKKSELNLNDEDTSWHRHIFYSNKPRILYCVKPAWKSFDYVINSGTSVTVSHLE